MDSHEHRAAELEREQTERLRKAKDVDAFWNTKYERQIRRHIQTLRKLSMTYRTEDK